MTKIQNTQHDRPENGEPKPLTVGELREHLEGYSDDTPVYLCTQSGDYWRTQLRSSVVLGSVENADEVALVEGQSWGAYDGEDEWLTVRMDEDEAEDDEQDEDEA